MKKMVAEYFRADFDETQMYKMTEDGHLFKFNYDTYIWDDVSEYEEFDMAWEPLEEYIAYMLIAHVYKNEKLWKYLDENKMDINPSFQIKYYKTKDNNVLMHASDDLYFICGENEINRTDKPKDDDIISPIKAKDLINTIRYPLHYKYTLKNMNLYLDDKKNVYAFYDDDKENVCFLSSVNQELVPLTLSFDETSSLYTKTSYEEIKKLYKEIDEEITKEEYDSFYNFNTYLNDKGSFINNKEDLTYYQNDYGDIFALDNENNEYHLSLDKIEKIEKGSINIEEWARVHSVNVMSNIEFYNSRKEALAKGDKVTLYDLKCYTHGNKFFGVSEDKKQYTIDPKGNIVPLENESYTPEHNVATMEAICYKSSVVNQYALNLYIDESEKELKDKGITIDNDMEFFCDFGEQSKGVFLKDGKNQIFVCEPKGLKPTNIDISGYESIAAINVLPLIKQIFLISQSQAN